MNARDENWQQQAEEERMAQTLDALNRVWQAGLRSDALFLAYECGVGSQFTKSQVVRMSDNIRRYG